MGHLAQGNTHRFPKRSPVGRIGRLIIIKIRLLSLTLYFLSRVCVSPVTLSLPADYTKPRLARPSHFTRLAPTPRSLRVRRSPPTGHFHEGAWHVPETTYCALSTCPSDRLSRTFPSLGQWAGRRKGLPSFAELPSLRWPAPFFHQPGPPRLGRRRFPGLTVETPLPPTSRGLPIPPRRLPSLHLALKAVEWEQTSQRPQWPCPTPLCPKGRRDFLGLTGRQRWKGRWRWGVRRGRWKINNRANLTYQLPGNIRALLGHGCPVGAGVIAGPTLIYGPLPFPEHLEFF